MLNVGKAAKPMGIAVFNNFVFGKLQQLFPLNISSNFMAGHWLYLISETFFAGIFYAFDMFAYDLCPFNYLAGFAATIGVMDLNFWVFETFAFPN